MWNTELYSKYAIRYSKSSNLQIGGVMSRIISDEEILKLKPTMVPIPEFMEYVEKVYTGIVKSYEVFHVKMLNQAHVYVEYPCGCIIVDKLDVKDDKVGVNYSTPIDVIRHDLSEIVKQRKEICKRENSALDLLEKIVEKAATKSNKSLN